MEASEKSQIAVIGLAVMGQNLALNIARNGVPVTVFNRTFDRTEATLQRAEPGQRMLGARTPEEVCAQLERPRRVLLLVKAGAPVDSTIEQFLPHLEAGDMIIDAGNSHPDDTERRSRDLEAKGFRFVGMGVSGGEEGALLGPSLMPGGEASAYEELSPILQKIAAQVDDGPCVTHVGRGSAGHFVKMVHNGIEYGDMQLIAESYDLMHNVLGMTHAQMADTFARWNDDFLESFLIEITAQILREQDPATGNPMVEMIVDKAGQKGTGRWTSELALRYGVPLPTIHAAVDARGLSSRKDERVAASRHLRGPDASAVTATPELVDAIRDALYCSKICSYAQGLDLLAVADREQNYGLDLGEAARIWKGGCIIRARLLARIQAAYGKNRGLPNLMLDDELGGFLVERQNSWRKALALATTHGVPVLAMASSLSYFDSYRRDRLPQNLTQAQRDLFGAHTFERTDGAPGDFVHHEWNAPKVR
jgi:6-phosphogluconate dehydrogenase